MATQGRGVRIIQWTAWEHVLGTVGYRSIDFGKAMNDLRHFFT